MRRIFLILLAMILVLLGSGYAFRVAQGWDDGMDQPRSEIHAAARADKVYVAGGIGLFRVLDSCEVYDRSTGQWDSCGTLPRPLHHVAMAAGPDRIFASGGYVALPFRQDQAPGLFQLVRGSQSWTERTQLPHPIGQHAMLYRDGRLYLIGGQNGSEDLASLWAYDLASGEWTALTPMPTARHSHAIAVSDDTLYVTGGRSAALGSEIALIEAYDFTEDRWQTLPAMPVGRGGHGAFVRDNKLHILGGESLTGSKVINRHDILDLAALTWTTGTPLTSARHGFAVADSPDSDEVLVIGGGAKPGMHTIYSVTGTVQRVAN